ncbi:DUF4192 family protein, partial [Mycobacterium sp. 1164985.4]|uniref:DUF4192 family protein n=1 Tax=Mycobacterium sp. 1164985.4 TaxID=1834069 RepID=UPI001E4528FF
MWRTLADRESVERVTDPAHADTLAVRIDDARAARANADACRDIEAVMAAAARVADGDALSDETLVRIAAALTDLQVRDTLYALAVGERAPQAEALWGHMP